MPTPFTDAIEAALTQVVDGCDEGTARERIHLFLSGEADRDDKLALLDALLVVLNNEHKP